MSLLYDDDQLAIANESRRILDARVDTAAQLALLEQQGAYDTAFWRTCVEQGWTALALPEAHGGLDLGLVELGIVAQSCGAVLSGAPFLTTSFGAARAIMRGGDGTTREAWLGRLAAGEAIGTVAIGEGQSPLPTRPQVTFANGMLDGLKPAVAGGLHADVAVVLASENGKPVLVVADLADVERRGFDSFDNSRCTADLVFAATPAQRLAGPTPGRKRSISSRCNRSSRRTKRLAGPRR